MAKKARQAKSTQKQAIPDDVKVRVNEIVEIFNKNEPKAKKWPYVARLQGKYLYLDRLDYGVPTRICRLTYTGDIDNWDFAIYRHSKERYDPDEGLFPGDEYVNGTIEGAMRAGLAAYPPAPALAGIRRVLGCLLILLPMWLITRLLQVFVKPKLKKEFLLTIPDTMPGEDSDETP